MINMEYSELLKLHNEISKNKSEEIYRIGILSNITISQIKELLELELYQSNLNSEVTIGDYDNIVQDSIKFKTSDCIIVFFEVCNYHHNFQSKIENYDDKIIEDLIEQIKCKIDLIVSNLSDTKLILFNLFSSKIFSYQLINKNNFEIITTKINDYLLTLDLKNLILINIDKILLSNGIDNSVDFRFYYLTKALYTINFLKSYCDRIKPILLAANGKTKKALILDCDNTLWGGVLGEDGFNNIQISENTKNGSIFSEVQDIIIDLQKRGVIIGLCSKNNSKDVINVIDNHTDMKIKNEHITISKINWLDKATNINQISKELNIGLDSIVFIDDSPYEIELIQQHLPEVYTIQVPKKLLTYPKLLRANSNLFYKLSNTDEDLTKTKQYKDESERNIEKSKFRNLDDYIKSLNLNMTIFFDNNDQIPRISQLTQKTNQFNLTTIRYTENDIERMVESKESKIISFSVDDKFGQSGITGLCILSLLVDDGIAIIDTFLMSCRVIGRNLEYIFMDKIIDEIKSMGFNSVQSKYKKTSKNEQVQNFYQDCGLSIISSTNDEKEYLLKIKKYNKSNIDYIKVSYDK